MTTLEYAQAYRKLGWSVIPIRPKDKLPLIKWGEFQKRIATEEEIKGWLLKWPDANIAVVTGKISNLVVMDFDSYKALYEFQATFTTLPQTIVSITGRASGEGRQHFFSYPEGLNIKNKTSLIADMDIRAEGGFVVVAPSQHKSGNSYKWGDIDPVEMGLDDLCELPNEAIKAFKSNNKKNNAENWINELLLGVSSGKRDDAACKVAGWLLNRNQGNVEMVWGAMLQWNQRNSPPLDEKQLRKVLDSISAREGTNSFNEITGITIDYLEILKYPDGLKEYRLNIKGIDSAITMTPGDVQSPARFELKMLELTDHLPAMPRKLEAWRKIINPLLDEATRVDVSEDETELATLNELISGELDRRGNNPDDPGSVIRQVCVSVNGVIYIKLSTLMRNAETTSLKRMSRKSIAGYLRLLGFKQKPGPKDFGNGVSHRVWFRKK